MNKITIEKINYDGPGGGIRYNLSKNIGPGGDQEVIHDLTFDDLVQLTAMLFTYVNSNK